MPCEHNYELADVAADFQKFICTKCGDVRHKEPPPAFVRCLPGEHEWIDTTVWGDRFASAQCAKCNERK